MDIPGYRLGTVIGQGGMGRVYEGEQLTLKRRVAIKVLAPELMSDEGLIKRFQLEITILSGLIHTNIVRVIDSGFNSTTFYYVMEYCENGTLKGHLRARRENKTMYTPREAVDLGVALLEGLDMVHERKVVHRDIKPGNIFFAENNRPVLGDFGLARDLDGVRLTIDPQAMGTPLYMSPEARLGENIDHRSDLFQIARVMYEMLSGEDPNTSAPIWLRLTPKSGVPDLARANPQVSLDLSQLIARALAWKPAERPQSAREFRDLLLAADLEVDPAAVTAQDITPAPRSPQRNETPRASKIPQGKLATGAIRTSGATSGGSANTRSSTRPPSMRVPAPVIPMVLIAMALVMGLGVGAFLFWPAAPKPVASAKPAGEPPRIEGLRVELTVPKGDDPAERAAARVPYLELTCAPASRVELTATAGTPPISSALAARHRLPLLSLPAGRHNLSLKLESASGSAVVTVPFAQTYPGGPPRHCLGIVLKECFDFGKHVNQPRAYDDTLMANIAATGGSAAAVLVDPERDDDGLIQLIKRYREYGIEVEFALYVNRYPAKPDEVVARLARWIRLIASLGQKQMWFSPGILIDTIGWAEGWSRYRDLLALVNQAGRDAPIPVYQVSGNLHSRDTQSLGAMLASGAGRYLNGVVMTHRYLLKAGPRPPPGMSHLESLALKYGVQKLEWIFDVSAPDEGQGGLLEHEMVGTVMADPALRDVAASLDQKSKKAGQPFLDLKKEEELYGTRFRETSRLMAGGAMGAIWDQNLSRDPQDREALRLRGNPLGIRSMLDFLLARPGEEPQPLATESQRARVGLESGGVDGVVRETAAGLRLMLWTETAPTGRATIRTSQPVLVTPLLQSQRGPFVSRLHFPSGGRVELPVGWTPIVVDLLP